MQQKSKLLKINSKIILLATMLLIPLSGFSRAGLVIDSTSIVTDKGDDKRAELKLKQRHSSIIPRENVYADGIKIKRDLSILKNIQERRILEEGEIPSDHVYQGMWANTGVRSAYTTIEKQIPDSFKVDLSNFTMPTLGSDYGHLTSPFGPRRRGMHYGFDLKVLTGDTIYAAFDGKIRVKQYERRGYGYYLVVRHSNGLESVYGHLSKFLVEEDQIVRSGQAIALGGNTGRSTGAHLHFEIRFMGKAIDPSLIVDVKNQVCHRDDFLITKNVLSDHRKVYLAGSGQVKFHRIRSGDTLGAIARKNKTSVKMLCALNNMTTKSLLRVGRSLKVPI